MTKLAPYGALLATFLLSSLLLLGACATTEQKETLQFEGTIPLEGNLIFRP